MNRLYCFGFDGAGEADGAIGGVVVAELFGTALAAGKTGAPGAGTAGADGFTGAGETEDWPVVCCLNSSRRSPVSRLVLCAYKTDKVKVSAKKIPVSQPVNLTRTLVVCAPKIFSVTPPPKAAPSPSLFGRCIRMTSSIRSATRT